MSGEDEDQDAYCISGGESVPSSTIVDPIPSSPLTHSPPTSPYVHSPPTSPRRAANETSDESSPPTPKRKRKRSQDEVSRATLQRRIQKDKDDASEVEQECSYVGNENVSIDEHGQERSDPVLPVHEDCGHNDEHETSTSTSDSESSDNISDVDSSDSNSNISDNGSHRSSSSARSSNSSDNNESDVESIDFLFEGSDMTSNEGLLEVLKIFVAERWTKTSLDKNIKLMKRMLPQPNDLPRNGKAALKKLEALTASFREREFTYCCDCYELVLDNENQCEHCESDNLDKFYSFDIDDQVRHMFEERDLASIIDYYRENHGRKDGHICDIQDGSEYKNIKKLLTGLYDMMIVWDTDGLALSKSSKQEIWPILATICEVPPRLRASYMLVCGVIVSEKKPDMNMFLKPFVDNLRKIHMNGGVSWTHPASKKLFSSMIVAPIFCADAPAKAMVLQNKNHNSRFGCNTCEQKSKKIQLTAEEQLENELQPNPRKRKRRMRRFLYQDDTDPAPLRSGARMDLQGKLAERRGKSRKGVLGNAVVSHIPFFDRARCVCVEYLHLIMLGVVKYFLGLIFFKNGPWYIGDKLEEIDRDIKNIKVPDFVKRLPRGIKDFKFWKASELRNFLLFYSLPLFKDRLPKEYFQHWLLLAGAVYIILQDAISEDDLRAAEIMLRDFVRDVGKLYNESCYTYNVHTLLHVCVLIRRWGPAWATAAFIFESFNGFIASHIHGTKHLGKEFINNIKIYQSVAILDNIVNARRLGFTPTALVPCTEKVLGKPIPMQFLDNNQLAALMDAQLGTFVLHIRAELMSQIYTSKVNDEDKRRANSIVQFHSEGRVGYGEILVFVKAQNGIVHCLIHVFKVVQVNILYHESSRFKVRNVLPISDSDNLTVIPASCVITKVLRVGGYISIRPNSYEVNL